MFEVRHVPLLLSVMAAVLASLACGAPEITPDAPTVAPAPEPTTESPRKRGRRGPAEQAPSGELAPWQEPFAAKETKDVRDYLMLLPDELFDCDVPEVLVRDEAARDAMIRNAHVSNGYLEVAGRGVHAQVALYRDTTNQRDVIGVVNNDGIGSMCNVVQFQTFSAGKRTWSEVDVLPREEISAAVEAGGGEFWWPDLPVQGTTTDIVDPDGKVRVRLKWADGRFTLLP